MTKDQLYEFDVNGYIILRGFLSGERVAQLRAALGTVTEAPVSGKFSFLGRDPLFLDLMAEPRTIAIMRVLVGPSLRFDHAFGIQMTKSTPVDDNLHGGQRRDQGAFFYEVRHGRMHNGQVAAVYALSDVSPGDGGFVCVPGSHKAAFDHYPRLDSHLVVNPALRAGDLLVFTEALVHGSRHWTAPHVRQSLFYLYVPGYMAYRAFEHMAPLVPRLRSDLQRELLRPPDVNSYPESAIQPGREWPTGNYRGDVQVPGAALALPERIRHRLASVQKRQHAAAYRLRRWLVHRGWL
jgi:ectoine hydroxylase-related dioxygenase (phytanoyl-CoA dioxygenase family)